MVSVERRSGGKVDMTGESLRRSILVDEASTSAGSVGEVSKILCTSPSALGKARHKSDTSNARRTSTRNSPETMNSNKLGIAHKSWTIRSRGMSGPAKQDSSILKAAVRPSLSARVLGAKACRSRADLSGCLRGIISQQQIQSGYKGVVGSTSLCL